MTNQMTLEQQADALRHEWATDDRWRGVRRDYSAEDVVRLRARLPVEHSFARHAAQRLWSLLHSEPYVATFGALTGAQAVQMVRAGLKAIYLSGWQVAADGNLAGQTYPDQSLYPSNSAPALVRRLNNALMRADQVDALEGRDDVEWYAPIVADAESGFGGPLHAFELMKSLIEAGAGGVHFEDQLAAEKKCGHLGGKVIIPTSQMIKTLTSARLAADVLGVPTLLIARTDALNGKMLNSDIDERDRRFASGARTPEGYYEVLGGFEPTVARSLDYAPYVDLLWFETSRPDLTEARTFAEAIHAEFPDQMLAYNCSPSFNWKQYLDDAEIAAFQNELGAMGYKFQFITLAGWHALNYHTFQLASDYRQRGMSAYVALQNQEFDAQPAGYTAARHQREAGTSYFDSVLMTITGGLASTSALAGSTEAEQFHAPADRVSAMSDAAH